LQSERNKADKVRRLNEEVDHLAQIALASRPRERSLVSASQPPPALRNAANQGTPHTSECDEHRWMARVCKLLESGHQHLIGQRIKGATPDQECNTQRYARAERAGHGRRRQWAWLVE
jgi:hypothetical protein